MGAEGECGGVAPTQGLEAVSAQRDDEFIIKLVAHLGAHLEGASSLIMGLRAALDKTQNPGVSDSRPSEEVWNECNDFCRKAEAALHDWDTRSELLSRYIRLQGVPTHQG
jgi:hypothetical protein